jgi:hypothetical protein
VGSAGYGLCPFSAQKRLCIIMGLGWPRLAQRGNAEHGGDHEDLLVPHLRTRLHGVDTIECVDRLRRSFCVYELNVPYTLKMSMYSE